MDILTLRSGIREKAIKLLGLVLLVFSSITLAADIQLTWDKPVEREDGSAIQEIEKYNLYYTVNNVLQDLIEIDASATSYTISDIRTGNHVVQLSTVESGLESELSDPKTINISDSKPVKILLTIEIVD